MMRLRFIISAIFLLTSAALASAEPQDSTAMAALSGKLAEYLAALDREPGEVKCREADFIIEVCSDSIVRQNVAMSVYRHFMDSKIMGDEGVAIHVFDRWFAGGEIKMDSEAELWTARLHATVNRQSLIGCRAAELHLADSTGNSIVLFPQDTSLCSARSSDSQPATRYSILYFYDTECAKCKMESILLRNILENDNFPVILYTIYAGHDASKWQSYVKEQLDINAPATETVHLRDLSGESDMATKYGVIQTPRMFLVSPEGIIIGRGLDTYSLEKMLRDLLAPKELEYGSDEAMEMFRTVFSPIEKGMGCDGVSMMADHISDKVLEMHDTTLYRQLTGDLLYFVSSQRGENYKCGTTQFVDKYILERSDIWTSADDSLKVVSLAEFMKNLAALSPVGQKMPKIKVPATVVTKNQDKGIRSSRQEDRKIRYRTLSLNSIGEATVIFHTEGCNICKAEIEAAGSMLESGRIKKVLLIDMDELFSGNPVLAGELMDKFDLSSLPFILTTDSKSRITRKYVSLR